MAQMAARRVGGGRLQNVCLCPGDLKDPVEGLELTVESRVRPHQKGEEIALEGRR